MLKTAIAALAVAASFSAVADAQTTTPVAPAADGSAPTPSPAAPAADGSAPQAPAAPAPKPTAAPWWPGDDPTNPDDGPLGYKRFGHVVDVWPYPAEATAGNHVVEVDSSYAITMDRSGTALTAEEEGIIDRAIARMKANTFKPFTRPIFRSDIFEDKIGAKYPGHELDGDAAHGNGCVITVKESGDALQHGMKEGYSLAISEDGHCNMHADTVWGVLRGLETLSQLIVFENYQDKLGFYIERTPVYINDKPHFGWRGLHVDTARHFEPKEYLFHILDGMSYMKLNCMHWHFTDSETFPFASKRFPELQVKATYTPESVYTYDDIKEIVDYAKDRGIRIMPEIDTPGHSAAIGQAYPEVSANCWDWLRSQFPQGLVWPAFNRIPLDVSKERTMEVIVGLWEEFAELFPDKFFHIGGDEVRVACWAQLPHFIDWMKERHAENPDYGFFKEDGSPYYLAAESWWMEKLQENLLVNPNISRSSVVWEESFRNNFTILPETLIHIWEDPSVMQRAVDEKKNHINSWGWYLDRMAPTCGFGEPTCPTQWMWIRSWIDMYRVDPYLGAGENPYNLGGLAASWAESIDPTNFDARVFSRLPAIAERLWRPYPATPQRLTEEMQEAQYRYLTYRCKLVQRGIRATSTASDWCDLSVFYPTLYGNDKLAESTPLHFGTTKVAANAQGAPMSSAAVAESSSDSGSSGPGIGWTIGAAFIGLVVGIVAGAVFMRMRNKRSSNAEADVSSVSFEK